MPDFLIWPAVALIAVIVLGIIGMLIFKKPITRLIDRTSKAGKDGITFERPQNEEAPNPALSFEELMKTPISPTVLSRDQRITQQLASFNLKKDEEKIAILIRAAAISRVEMEYTNISNSIFGSQINLLIQISATSGGLSRAEAEKVFFAAQQSFPELHGKKTFDEWIRYPSSHGLVAINNQIIDITQYGKDFLKYLIDSRQTHQRYG